MEILNDLPTLFEWVGTILGVGGAFLLAINTRISHYGWLLFLAANVSIVTFAFMIDRKGLMTQQVFFTATSLIGMYRTGLFTRAGWVRLF